MQLLHRLKIRSADGSEMLLKVVKSPFSRHLPPNARCFGMSHKGEVYNPQHFVSTQIPDDVPIVIGKQKQQYNYMDYVNVL